MSTKITPDEGFILERALHIQTRCAKALITEEMIETRAVNANLAAGDHILVQCMTHDKTTVLYQRNYLVYARTSKLQRDEINDRDVKTYEKITYGVEPLDDWFATRAGKAEEEAAKEAAKPKKVAA